MGEGWRPKKNKTKERENIVLCHERLVNFSSRFFLISSRFSFRFSSFSSDWQVMYWLSILMHSIGIHFGIIAHHICNSSITISDNHLIGFYISQDSFHSVLSNCQWKNSKFNYTHFLSLLYLIIHSYFHYPIVRRYCFLLIMNRY